MRDQNESLCAILQIIWAELLGVSQVAADDDFFRLGGDSLRALDLTSRLDQELGIELDPVEIFETPRFASFLERVAQASASAAVVSR